MILLCKDPTVQVFRSEYLLWKLVAHFVFRVHTAKRGETQHGSLSYICRRPSSRSHTSITLLFVVPGVGVQGQYNTAAPLYSSFLANKLNMRKAYQQYALCMAGLAVAVSMATRFTRACNLIRYVNYSKHGRQSEAEYAAFMAQAQSHDLERAERIIARFRSGNITAAFAFPVLWMAFKTMPSSASYSR